MQNTKQDSENSLDELGMQQIPPLPLNEVLSGSDSEELSDSAIEEDVFKDSCVKISQGVAFARENPRASAHYVLDEGINALSSVARGASLVSKNPQEAMRTGKKKASAATSFTLKFLADGLKNIPNEKLPENWRKHKIDAEGFLRKKFTP